MMTPSTRAKTTKVLAALAASASFGSLIVSNPTPAGADPQSATALVGVGSDTTQDVMNALAGFSNGTSYTPIKSDAASGFTQLASWDATPPGTCITPKAPGATFDRPNGSTAGRQALSRAIDGTPYVVSGSPCTPAKALGGLVDFARSSAGPATSTATDLTYLPYGRDAVSFAYYGNGVAPATSLTSAQLSALYTSGPQNIGGVTVQGCLPQVGSGTRKFWVAAMGTTDSIATTATAGCGVPLEENDGNALKARGSTLASTEVVIPFSAAGFIAQSNGASPSRLNNAAGVDLGAIDALGKPYTGTTPPLAPNAGFYASTTYGRDVYNVADTARVTGFGNADIKTLLVGPASAICAAPAQTIVNRFGFLSLGASCGSTTLKGPLL